MTSNSDLVSEGDCVWVGDADNWLAHLSWDHWGYGFSICGVELACASAKKAEGRSKCSACEEELERAF